MGSISEAYATEVDKDIIKLAKKVLLECKTPTAYALDGEVRRDTKVEIEILSNKLKFVVPKE